MRAVRVGGHTTHHQMVVVGEGGETLVVPTDLLPTASHLPLPFVMGYDLFPVATLEAKRTLLSAAADGGWRILFYHDARTPLGRVRREGDGFTLEASQLSEATAHVGIIGGSGLYEMEGVTGAREIAVETPVRRRPPTGSCWARSRGGSVAFLPRHGRGHRILPSEINFQANVYALKTLGVERILSVSAVGSLKEKYAPLHMVIPDQFVDRTFKRASTFFGRGPGGARGLRASLLRGRRARAGRGLRGRRAPPCTRAAPTSASRGRSSPPARSPSSTGRGAWTSSA